MDREFGVLYRTHDEKVYFSSFIKEGDLWFPEFPHTEIEFPIESLAIEVYQTELVLVEVMRTEDAEEETTTYLRTVASLDFEDGVEIAIAHSIVADNYREMFNEIYSSLRKVDAEKESIYISPDSNRRLH